MQNDWDQREFQFQEDQQIKKNKLQSTGDGLESSSFCSAPMQLSQVVSQDIKTFNSADSEIYKMTKAQNPQKNHGHSDSGCIDFGSIRPSQKTCFFQLESIKTKDLGSMYKDYSIPLSSQDKLDFMHSFCAISNTRKGQIYLNIIETPKKKYRYVMARFLTETEKKFVINSLWKILSDIMPISQSEMGQLVDFIPVRQSPYKVKNFKELMEKDRKDLLQKYINPQNYPYKQGMYVIRVRISLVNQKLLSCYLYGKNDKVFPVLLPEGAIKFMIPQSEQIKYYCSQRIKKDKKSVQPKIKVPVELGIPIRQINPKQFKEWKENQTIIRSVLSFQDNFKEKKLLKKQFFNDSYDFYETKFEEIEKLSVSLGQKTNYQVLLEYLNQSKYKNQFKVLPMENHQNIGQEVFLIRTTCQRDMAIEVIYQLSEILYSIEQNVIQISQFDSRRVKVTSVTNPSQVNYYVTFDSDFAQKHPGKKIKFYNQRTAVIYCIFNKYQ